jgi:transcriptional regulator with XRE-family HTH domain
MSTRNSRRRQQFRVGEKIRELRKERNLTQAELAAKVGVQQSDLCRMETGEYRVSLDILFRILGIFGMNIGEFFQEQEGAADGEQEILALWRRLDRRGREEALNFLRFKCRQEAGS